MKKVLLVALVLALASATFGQKYYPDEQAVRDVIEKWNSGYTSLNPETMASVLADVHEIVNRFGENIVLTSREEYKKMWQWTFTNVYKGKPGPSHRIQHVRRLSDEAASDYSDPNRASGPPRREDGTAIYAARDLRRC